MGVKRSAIDELDPADCLRLLASRSMGRLGITIASLPAILPVTYQLVDDLIVIHLDGGTDLGATRRHEIVAFEVDDLDEPTGTGWSVLVRGFARGLHLPRPLGRANRTSGGAEPEGDGPDFIGVSTDVVSGRRMQRLGPRLDLRARETSS